VRYVVVGGMAVVMSGHVRATSDFADPDVRVVWIRDKHMQVLSFFDPHHIAREVDVLVSYPLDFDRLLAGAVATPIGERLVPVVTKEHLIEMKRAAGRPRDLADIEALQRLIERDHDHER
jgi:hypothetical protein